MTLETLGLSIDDHLELANPLSRERPYLQRSLVPNLLEAARKNQPNEKVLALFEISRVFLEEEQQPYNLALVYSVKGDDVPFFGAKTMVVGLLKSLGFDCACITAKRIEPWSHPARRAQIVVGGRAIGTVAEIAPRIGIAFGFDRRVAVAEIDLSLLVEQPRAGKRYRSVPVYPSVSRDVAFTVPCEIPWGDIEKRVRICSPLLESIELFDVYRGHGIEEGEKSMAVHLTLRASDRTLDAHDADEAVKSIARLLEKEFCAIMRV